MKNRAILLLSIVFILASGLSLLPQAKQKTALHQKYQYWLDLVHYIITPIEKATFNKLKTNRERDIFIQLFWKQRDPTKGTPANEFRDEHIRRFNYANQRFKYESPRAGWRTDRGRIYILLGPPVSENEVTANGLYPVLIWDYYGGPELGLPTMFNIVFYKKGGFGRYRLYVPAEDGPGALLQAGKNVSGSSAFDVNDYERIYTDIHEINPQVARISLSLIPDEPVYNFTPSMQDPILISKIYELPKEKLNATYARNFLRYQGLVNVSVTTNYINSTSNLFVLKDPFLNENFVHFAIMPDTISVDYTKEQDKYYFNYQLTVVLSRDDEIIYQHTKNYPFYYTKQEVDTVLSRGMVIADYLPVVNGTFHLKAIIQNSINGEIIYFEKNFASPDIQSSPPQIYGPIVTYQIKPNEQQAMAAFKILNQSITIDPKKQFGYKEPLQAYFSIDGGMSGQPVSIEAQLTSIGRTGENFSKTYTYTLPSDKNFSGFTQNLEQLDPGYYNFKITLYGKNKKVLTTRDNTFTVSIHPTLSHPPNVSKLLRNEHRFVVYMILAEQYKNLKNTDMAELYYKQAYRLSPANPQLIKAYATFMLEQGQYQRVPEIVEGLKGDEKYMFDFFALRGKAEYGMGNYLSAIQDLLEANKIYDSDITVLNTLGFALIRTGNKQEALRPLSASLTIKNQEKIKEILDQLKEDLKSGEKK